MANHPTRTTNRLHFSDLDPLRFEDLCLSVVARIQDWKALNHFGRKGTDGGVDIHAVQQIGQEDRVWFIQCKRYSTISKTDMTAIIDEVVKNSPLPNKLLVIVACDVSRAAYEHCQAYAHQQQIEEVEIWTASTLEARLYKEHKDLLFVYFGMKLERTRKDNAARVRNGLTMGKKVQKDLIRKDVFVDPKAWDTYHYEPYYKFISQRVNIISVDDTTYPEYTNQSAWNTLHFYDTYHDGIDFWLNAAVGADILIDKNGFWDVANRREDSRLEDPQYRVIKAMSIGRVPYYNIVGYKAEGDEHNHNPIIYCHYSFDGRPFEEIYYRTDGVARTKTISRELDKKKRVSFPMQELYKDYTPVTESH